MTTRAERSLPLEERIFSRMLKIFGPEGEKWVKGVYAVRSGADTSYVSVTDDEAARFCLSGACARARHELGLSLDGKTPERARLERAVERYMDDHGVYRGAGAPTVVGFNDHDATTFADVKEVLKNAIRSARRAGR